MSATQLYLSPIVAGVWKWGIWGHELDTQDLLALIEGCIDNGVTSFDHADIYGHYTDEERFGKTLALKPSLRQQMQLVTKCGIRLVTPNRPHHKIKSYDTSKEHIIASTENSLKALHTDYIDLLLIHRPDPLMDPDEIAEAFSQLKQEGKVLHFGVSNFTPSQFEMLKSRTELVTNQVEISILHLEPFLDGTLDQCITHHIRPMAWSPLGSGQLFGTNVDERTKRILHVAKDLAEKHGAGVDQLLLAWLLKHPSRIIPVLGTARIARIKAAMAARQIELSREEWFELWQASMGKEVP